MIMMDFTCRKMDGYECTSHIRAMDDEYFKDIPIIVFSAFRTRSTQNGRQWSTMTDFMKTTVSAMKSYEKS